MTQQEYTALLNELHDAGLLSDEELKLLSVCEDGLSSCTNIGGSLLAFPPVRRIAMCLQYLRGRQHFAIMIRNARNGFRPVRRRRSSSLTPSYKRWCRTGEMCGMHPVTIIQNRHLPQLLQLTVAACFVYSNSIRLPFPKPGEIHRGNCPQNVPP